jgi:hypothetical protein
MFDPFVRIISRCKGYVPKMQYYPLSLKEKSYKGWESVESTRNEFIIMIELHHPVENPPPALRGSTTKRRRDGNGKLYALSRVALRSSDLRAGAQTYSAKEEREKRGERPVLEANLPCEAKCLATMMMRAWFSRVPPPESQNIISSSSRVTLPLRVKGRQSQRIPRCVP